MVKIRKATPEEKAEYWKTSPVYPLYGYIKHDGHELAIEDLRCWPKEDPQYEVLAPDGHIFCPDGLHTILCHTLKDVRARVMENDIVEDDS